MTRRSTSSGSPARDPEEPGVLGRRRRGRDRPGAAPQREPGPAAPRGATRARGRPPSRRRRTSRSSTVDLERDRLVVRAAEAAEMDDRLAARRCPSAAASAGVDGRMARASTREFGMRPRRRISWVNVIRRLARRWAGGSATKLPRPGWRATRPSSARRCIAFRAVIRLTPNSATARRRTAAVRPAEPGDALAERMLDATVVRDVRRRRSSAGVASAPWTAAPIAPAHVPSSAVTSSTSLERRRLDAPPRSRPGSGRAAGRRPPRRRRRSRRGRAR